MKRWVGQCLNTPEAMQSVPGLLQSRANYKEVLQGTRNILILTGVGQTEAISVGGPEPAHHLCPISSTDHPGKDSALCSFITASSSASPHRMGMKQRSLVWVEMPQGCHVWRVAFSSQPMLPVLCHSKLDKLLEPQFRYWVIKKAEGMGEPVLHTDIPYLMEP